MPQSGTMTVETEFVAIVRSIEKEKKKKDYEFNRPPKLLRCAPVSVFCYHNQ